MSRCPYTYAFECPFTEGCAHCPLDDPNYAQRLGDVLGDYDYSKYNEDEI